MVFVHSCILQLGLKDLCLGAGTYQSLWLNGSYASFSSTLSPLLNTTFSYAGALYESSVTKDLASCKATLPQLVITKVTSTPNRHRKQGQALDAYLFQRKVLFQTGSAAFQTDVREGMVVFFTSAFYCGEARAFTYGLKFKVKINNHEKVLRGNASG